MKKILLMLSLLFFTTAGFSEVSDTLVTGGYDKQAMSDAIKHARKETDKFIEVMNKKDADTFAVKAPKPITEEPSISGSRMSLILTACLLA